MGIVGAAICLETKIAIAARDKSVQILLFVCLWTGIRYAPGLRRATMTIYRKQRQ